ncbi:O-antigen ligase family protein [Paraburkholderia rhizosphaerae]|uniref:O-antigen ligase n=1 Tax=Paraburkholderia rhizosphaerae TaxID=480658 RepID=A0A4R8LN30_9BURK|nr:O-antigen ligase family protein [Paraburkholderia rhizosphaerae]TDY47626.1 O-antigen ligase [Paraburkholderia rhizosphaerae]
MSVAAARIERALWIACPVLLFVVMFAHMTAIVYIALALLAIGTLAAAWSAWRARGANGMYQARRPKWPLALPIAAWAIWTLASIGWSFAPSVSLHAWFDEVFYPLVAFWAFWLLGTKSARPERLVLFTWLACAALVVTSVINWGHLQPPTAETFTLHYYARVGHTSTLAIFALTLFTGQLLTQPRWRLAGATGIAMCLFIGLATLNRFFWPAVAVTLLIALYPLYRRHLVLAAISIAIIAVAGLGTLELSSRMRIGEAAVQAPPRSALQIDGHAIFLPRALSGIDDTMAGDTRPRLWAFYTSAAESHAWFGIGFGKPLPGLAYHSVMPDALLKLEPVALTHAHNLFLNTWLQTGVIGVALQIALLAALVGRFWRLRQINLWLCTAGIALVVGMIAKNFTDDFMWQTTMLAFWSFAGLMLGSGERRRDARMPTPRMSRDVG